MPLTNFCVVQQRFAEIKRSDWTFQVTWLFLTDQSALFRDILTLVKNMSVVYTYHPWSSLVEGGKQRSQ